jgi:hypothetical protein
VHGAPRIAGARGFVNFRKKIIHESRARAARPRGFDCLPSKVLQEGTLPVLLLGGIIENQNSDFVMQ